ncbi:MAG: RHS repeat-associated core domain-containing protein [Candidatus Omnitrophota bacterium]
MYTYDSEDQLINISSPGTSVSYRYDALGRRIEKDVDGQITKYVYDGEDIIAEYDANNNIIARYTHGPSIDEPLILEKSGQTYYYQTDGLGSVTNITDANNQTVKTYQYDSFGNIISTTGSLTQPFTYTGREYDSESGLYYYRARYYDPAIGRFLQEDPVWDTNLYLYVDNNAVNYIDPEGLLKMVFNGGGHIPVSAGTALGMTVQSEWDKTGLHAAGTSIDMVMGDIVDVGFSLGIGDISNTCGEKAGGTLSLNHPLLGKYGGIQLTFRNDFNWSDPGTWIPDGLQVGIGLGISLPSTYTEQIGFRDW